MAESKLDKAMKVGDNFVKERFSRNIRRNSNILLVLILMLAVLDITDQTKDLMYFDVTMIERIESVMEIVIVAAISLIGYTVIVSLKKWESTYRKVRDLLR